MECRIELLETGRAMARDGHTCSLPPFHAAVTAWAYKVVGSTCLRLLHALQRLRNIGLVDKPLIMQCDPQQQDPTPTSQRHSLSRLFLRT